MSTNYIKKESESTPQASMIHPRSEDMRISSFPVLDAQADTQVGSCPASSADTPTLPLFQLNTPEMCSNTSDSAPGTIHPINIRKRQHQADELAKGACHKARRTKLNADETCPRPIKRRVRLTTEYDNNSDDDSLPRNLHPVHNGRHTQDNRRHPDPTSDLAGSEHFYEDLAGFEDALSQIYGPDMPTGREHTTKASNLVDLMRQHNIHSHQQWDDLPFDIKRPYLTMTSFNTIFQTTMTQLANESRGKLLLIPDSVLPPTTSRIFTLLTQHQLWTTDECKRFIDKVMRVINRNNGKKNCLWLWGASNAGKSQLLETFVKGIAPGLYGVPLQTLRSSFQFGNCANKRVIFWEEPVINNDNIEAVKCLFAGGSFSTDVKYKDNIIIPPTR